MSTNQPSVGPQVSGTPERQIQREVTGVPAAGQDLYADAGRGGELAGIAGEPGRSDPGRGVTGLAAARGGLRGLLPGALLHDGLDLGDADHVELQRRRARLPDRVVAVGAAQADQRV